MARYFSILDLSLYWGHFCSYNLPLPQPCDRLVIRKATSNSVIGQLWDNHGSPSLYVYAMILGKHQLDFKVLDEFYW